MVKNKSSKTFGLVGVKNQSYTLATLASLLGLMLLPLFAAPNVYAEESQSLPVLEEIIVRARKRSESVQDVPVTITAISSKTLKAFAVDSLEQVASMTPQLFIGSQSTQTGGSITLRGIGAGTDNPATDQAVSINMDGLQVSQANVLRLGQFDLQQVEILKGPQALFFGKNSPEG